jgi:Fe-S cluster assembly protein SufD
MSATARSPVATEHFLARFDGLAQRRTLAMARQQAADVFRASGLPTPREEAWHYTPLNALTGIEFAEPLTPVGTQRDLAERLPVIDAPRVVFVDGRFDPGLSEAGGAVAIRTGSPAFGPLARPASERLVALNSLLAEDGAAIEVADGSDGGTLVLASLGTDEHGRAVSFHPRHALRVEAGARLTLIEVASGEGVYLNNPVLEITVEPGASLTHLRLQNEADGAFHLSTVYADVAAGGRYDSVAVMLGASLSRMESHVRLRGSGASTHLNAALLLAGRQHADFTTVVAHDAPSCASRQTVKSVLNGRSHGVFQGKIAVARVAQKTDGYQMNQALLLSPDAEMDSKPQLEIYADDVKCSHGATVGALDPEQLFYLRSRGIPEGEARPLLVRAFLAEALDPIRHEAGRALMEQAIADWWERQS